MKISRTFVEIPTQVTLNVLSKCFLCPSCLGRYTMPKCNHKRMFIMVNEGLPKEINSC